MNLNNSDGGKRRFVLIQVPEPLDPEKKDQKAAAKFCDDIARPRTIAEIAKERIRRAGATFTTGSPAVAAVPPLLSPVTQTMDVGFRVLKIDASNMKDVYYTPDESKQGALLGQIDNIKADRTTEDLLFQVLLDWGVDLTLPIAQESVADKTVYFVDGNALAACFDADVNEEFVKEIAKRKPLRAVFRDSSFGSDSVKINVEQIFKLLSPSTEVRSI
jgi:adenine-specific DNA-methyltransferase